MQPHFGNFFATFTKSCQGLSGRLKINVLYSLTINDASRVILSTAKDLIVQIIDRSVILSWINMASFSF